MDTTKQGFSAKLARDMDYKLVLPREIPASVNIGRLLPVHIDLHKYLGYWYERMRLPTLFEQGLSHVSADYRMSPDGTLRVTNQGWIDAESRWKTSVGLARKTNHTGVLLVTFGYFYSPYIVIYNDHYQTAVVASPSGQFLWILTRHPFSPINLNHILPVLCQNGYDASILQSLELVNHN